MKRALTAILLTLAAAITVIWIAAPLRTATGANLATITPTSFAYLPFVSKQPTPTPTYTPTPTLCHLYVQNNTGGELCYEVYGTGIGRRCFSPGSYAYGSFTVGTYSWSASARCGTANGSRYYGADDYVHSFWCGANAAATSATGAPETLNQEFLRRAE